MGRAGGSYEVDKKSGKQKKGGHPNRTREVDAKERHAKKLKDRAEAAKKIVGKGKAGEVTHA